MSSSAADKLRELLATRPAMPNTEELARWWRSSGLLLLQLFEDVDAETLRLKAEMGNAERQAELRGMWYLEAGKERDEARAQIDKARDAAQRLVAQVGNLGAFADDSDPRVMATAGPISEAQADLWVALGLDLDKEAARLQADIESRCAVCGWTLVDKIEDGCVRGNCSLRPRPERLYAPERAAKEAGLA